MNKKDKRQSIYVKTVYICKDNLLGVKLHVLNFLYEALLSTPFLKASVLINNISVIASVMLEKINS